MQSSWTILFDFYKPKDRQSDLDSWPGGEEVSTHSMHKYL